MSAPEFPWPDGTSRDARLYDVLCALVKTEQASSGPPDVFEICDNNPTWKPHWKSIADDLAQLCQRTKLGERETIEGDDEALIEDCGSSRSHARNRYYASTFAGRQRAQGDRPA
jgi:hypothetical protein